MPTISKNSVVKIKPQDAFINVFSQHNKRKLNICFNDLIKKLPYKASSTISQLKPIEKESFCEFIDQLRSKKAKFVDEKTLSRQDESNFVLALTSIFNWKLIWLRQVDSWQPNSHNVYKQFYSLITHLFVKYPMPSFMYSVWFGNNETHKEWFINLAQGENLRKQKKLPITITKMMAHYFLQAPSYCTVDQAIQWGQMMSMQIDKNTASKVIKSPIGNHFSNNDFWITVIKFLFENPFIPFSYYTQIYDYINYVKFQPRGNIIQNGEVVLLGPLQPNFSMKGRTPESLLRAVDAWHKTGMKSKHKTNLTWSSCGIPTFTLKKKECSYEIIELLSSDQLIKEAEAMQHCVWSYDKDCFNKISSIFSMRKWTNENPNVCQIKLTIQVSLANSTICQARKRFNAEMGGEEITILTEWARLNKLKIGTYL